MNQSEVLPRPHQTDSFTSTNPVVGYYNSAPRYLEGILRGTCHYGFTPEGEPFDLERALRAMEELLGDKLELPEGSRVLDAGCGFGRVASTLREKYKYEVTGVDLMLTRLKEAQYFNKFKGTSDGVEVTGGDYHALPFRDSSFDGVFTIETLVHANPLEKALAEFRRVLRPNGKLALFEYTVPDLDSLPPLVRRVAGRVVERTSMTSLHRFTHNAFPGLLAEAGFTNIKVEDISRNVYPSWFCLFKDAISETLEQVYKGRFNPRNVRGSLLIWPARHHLGYKVVTATKPQE